MSNLFTGHHGACQTFLQVIAERVKRFYSHHKGYQTSSQVTTKRVKCLNGSERVSNVLTGKSGCQTSLQVRARVKRLFQVRPLVKRLYRSKRLSAVFTGQSTCQAPSQVTLQNPETESPSPMPPQAHGRRLFSNFLPPRLSRA